jgi:hypothetical protein
MLRFLMACPVLFDGAEKRKPKCTIVEMFDFRITKVDFFLFPQSLIFIVAKLETLKRSRKIGKMLFRTGPTQKE